MQIRIRTLEDLIFARFFFGESVQAPDTQHSHTKNKQSNSTGSGVRKHKRPSDCMGFEDLPRCTDGGTGMGWEAPKGSSSKSKWEAIYFHGAPGHAWWLGSSTESFSSAIRNQEREKQRVFSRFARILRSLAIATKWMLNLRTCLTSSDWLFPLNTDHDEPQESKAHHCILLCHRRDTARQGSFQHWHNTVITGKAKGRQ